jgi:hypothetical protein
VAARPFNIFVLEFLFFDESMASTIRSFVIKQIENTISVDVIFFHEGPTTAQDVPVKFVNDPNAKLVYYEFETAFDGFPEISEDDPRYDQPFSNWCCKDITICAIMNETK